MDSRGRPPEILWPFGWSTFVASATLAAHIDGTQAGIVHPTLHLRPSMEMFQTAGRCHSSNKNHGMILENFPLKKHGWVAWFFLVQTRMGDGAKTIEHRAILNGSKWWMGGCYGMFQCHIGWQLVMSSFTLRLPITMEISGRKRGVSQPFQLPYPFDSDFSNTKRVSKPAKKKTIAFNCHIYLVLFIYIAIKNGNIYI